MIARTDKLSRRTFIAGASALGVALSACSRQQPSFRMQASWVNDAEFMGYFVALTNGYYRDSGLTLDYKPGGPEVTPEVELLSRKADLGLTTVESTVNLILKEKAPLKIIGTQYQKSPLGVVSLAKSGIKEPKDLVGRTLAVPAANTLTVDALFRINGVDKKKVKIVPYQYDPKPLVSGEVDATIDFTTNVPYSIKQAGAEPYSFLLYDFGFKVFNDTVVVTEETLRQRRSEVINWIRASRRGWDENFRDPAKYPPLFRDSYFKGSGRTIDNEIYFNKAQMPLIQSPKGIFSMSDDAVRENIETLKGIGVSASPDMFVTDLA
jgi:ABC-type nitrate/sulfonate/bicarbonate transport system substrate-binding protein